MRGGLRSAAYDAPVSSAAVAREVPTAGPPVRHPGWGLWLAAVAVVAVVVRVTYALVVDPQVPEVSDASAYHLLGRHLAQGLGYIRPFDLTLLGEVRPTAEYPPVLPALLGLADLLGVDGVDGQQLVLCVLGTVTVVLVGLLGREVAGPTVGLTAAALAAVYPMLFQSDAVLMPETPFALLVTAALLLAVRAARRPTPARFAAAGAVVGLAALTRAEGLLLAPLLLAPLAARAPGPLARRLALATAGLAVAALVVAPWTVRNAARFDGALVPVSNNLGTALDGANCDKTWSTDQTGLWLYECFGGFDLSEQDEAEAAAFHRRRGLRYVADHLGRLPAVVLVREARTFGLHRVEQQVRVESFEGRTVRWQALGTRTWWALAVLAAGGLVVLLRRRAPVWPLASTLVLVVATTAVTYGNQRFRVAAEPAVVVLAAVAVVALIGGGRRTGPTSRAATTPDRGAPARAR